jgi:hypothetical protein
VLRVMIHQSQAKMAVAVSQGKEVLSGVQAREWKGDQSHSNIG